MNKALYTRIYVDGKPVDVNTFLYERDPEWMIERVRSDWADMKRRRRRN